MLFGSFLMLIAITIAGVSAYFSVYGLAHIFAATFWSVVIMGGVLEVGKLVATSFLYRYWDRITWSLRVYLLAAIAGLMIITSAGIFGYLSNAYQQDIIGVKDVGARIELLDNELTALTTREQQINADIDRIGSNFVTARQNMIKQYGPEKDKITVRIADIRKERLELSTKQLEVEAHTGPIIYIAKAMDKDVDTAVMWMICLIIFVFDPLAVALTIGANVVFGLKPSKPETPMFDCRLCGTEYSSMYAADVCEGDCLSELNHSQSEPEPEPEPEPEQIAPHVQMLVELGDGIGGVRVDASDPETTLKNLQAAFEASKKRALKQAELEYQALEEDNNRKQSMIDELSADNQQMEEEMFVLASVLEKKELQITQLKEAVRALDPTPSYTIEQRAELHAANIAANKS